MGDVRGVASAPPKSASLVPPLLATLFVAGAFGGTYACNQTRFEELAFVAATPAASAPEPLEGVPAVYAGTVHGPAGRVTAAGARAAAYWYWVERVPSEKKKKTVCAGDERDRLVLRSGGRELRLALFDGRAELALLSDDRDSDWEGALAVDLAETPTFETEVDARLPERARWCQTDYPRYIERHVPEGAAVEVLACHRGGVLEACDAVRHGILAVGGLAAHQARAVDNVVVELLIAGGFCLVVLLGVCGAALAARNRTLRRLQPVRRAP